ncbi:MAG: HAD-IA family hydrolase [Acidobacteriota bacterium]
MTGRDSKMAVLLDVGGTLIECRPSPPSVYADALARRRLPVEPARVAGAFTSVWTEMTQEHPPGLDRYHHLKGGERAWWGEFLRRVLVRLDLRLEWEPVLDELFETFSDPGLWRVFPEVHEVLDRLRRRGLKLAAVSNWDSRLPALLDRLDLTHALDVVMVSALEGVEKPAPEIFHRAAGRLGVVPAACLHVGDSPLDDYRGAESAGMTAVLVDRQGLFADGYRRVRDLRGLDEFLS